ncbi:MAG: hypothetical protein KAS59_09285 [Alphaproteobacteria bacterium]|nr:hypothetical protein [Alphaproteobacteria bacterium]
MCPVIRISDELYSRLESLVIGFDTPTNVIERLLNEKGIKKMPPQILKDEKLSVRPDLPASEFQKMNRIEGWAKKDRQPDVGKVVQSYLDLTDGNAGIDTETFIIELEKKKIYNGEYSKIKSNLSQMKNDNGNQHGKIFYNKRNSLVMYDAAYKEVLKFFNE